jgi:hypothetical protein
VTIAGRGPLVRISKAILEELTELCERVEVGRFVFEKGQHHEWV